MAQRLVITVKPHVLEGFGDGWKPKTRALPNASAELIGRVLINHLIAEHYLTACLELVGEEDITWDGARLTFGQKIELLGGKGGVLAELSLLGGLKRLNRLRNDLAHQLDRTLTKKDVAPLRAYLLASAQKRIAVPTEPLLIIDTFTSLACAVLLGYITGTRGARRLGRRKPS